MRKLAIVIVVLLLLSIAANCYQAVENHRTRHKVSVLTAQHDELVGEMQSLLIEAYERGVDLYDN